MNATMESEKSEIEILKEFAHRSNRKIEYSEKTYKVGTIKPRYFVKSHVVITDNEDSSLAFVSYGDTQAFGDNTIYSGLFFPISSPNSSKILIRKKNILDKLNPFLKHSNHSDGFSDFNSSVVITDNDYAETTKIFGNKEVQYLTKKAFNLDERIRVGINNFEIEVLPDFKGQSHFGVYMTEQWFLDDAVIEQLFTIADKFKRLMSESTPKSRF